MSLKDSILFTSIILLILVFHSFNIRINDLEYSLSESKEKQLEQLTSISNLTNQIQDNEDLIHNVFNLRFYDNVVATVYHPVPEQTDDTPNITADGTMIEIDNASDYRYIAVSRDLHKRYGGTFDFNDIVYINSDEISGFYIIKDLMNKRFTKRIDFLHSPETPAFKLDNVELYQTNIKTVL